MTFIRRCLLLSVTATIVVSPLLQTPAQAGKTADAIAGGLIGAAIVAAASKHHHHHEKYSYGGYRAPYQPGGYDPYWNNMFKPKGDVICYRAQAACYNLNGSFNAKWTMRAFADGE